MWKKYNPNPYGRAVGDCSVRAVAKALGIDWSTAYMLTTKAGYSMDGSYDGGSYGGSYEGNGNRSYRRGGRNFMRSYARGRGRNARRDNMGRYSGDGYSMDSEEMVQQLREMMQEAPDDRTRQEFQRFIQKMETL